MKKMLLVMILAGLAAGCSTMTIHPKASYKRITEPTYQLTVPFYFWGLSGAHRLDVNAICGDKKPVQMQTQATVENMLLTLVTLGIYAPHTAKVWCE